MTEQQHPAAEPLSAPEHVISRRAVTSWVLYDLANTIFSMGVISLVFPLWIRQTVGAEWRCPFSARGAA